MDSRSPPYAKRIISICRMGKKPEWWEEDVCLAIGNTTSDLHPTQLPHKAKQQPDRQRQAHHHRNQNQNQEQEQKQETGPGIKVRGVGVAVS